MVKKRMSPKDKRRIKEEIQTGYFGDGKYVVFLGNRQCPVIVVDNVGKLPNGEKIYIPREHKL